MFLFEGRVNYRIKAKSFVRINQQMIKINPVITSQFICLSSDKHNYSCDKILKVKRAKKLCKCFLNYCFNTVDFSLGNNCDFLLKVCIFL